MWSYFRISLNSQKAIKSSYWVDEISKINFRLIVFRSKLFSDFFNFQIIVDKIHVTFLPSPLSPHSMLINEWLRHQKAEFSAKTPTTTNLQHWIKGKGGNGNKKSRFFGVTSGFVQDWSFLLYKVFGRKIGKVRCITDPGSSRVNV